MPQKGDVHVLPSGDGKWIVDVEEEGGGTKHESQEEAIAAARSIAHRHESELLIHGEDGQIRQRDSHGHDPRDVPG